MASLAAPRRTLTRTGVAVLREAWLPVALLALWWLLSKNSSSFYFPPLAEIWQRFRELWLFERVPSDVWPSIRDLLLALVISCAIGIPVGLLLGMSRRLQSLVEPLLNFAWSLPKLALLPAFIAVIGLGRGMQVSFIVAGAVWPILLGTVDGVRAVDPVLQDMMRSYRIGRWTMVWRILIPGSMPQVFAGIRTSLSIGLVLMIVGEMLAGSSGLGYFVLQAQQSYALVDMWAGALLVGLLGYLINVFFTLVERWLLGWHFARRAMHTA